MVLNAENFLEVCYKIINTFRKKWQNNKKNLPLKDLNQVSN